MYRIKNATIKSSNMCQPPPPPVFRRPSVLPLPATYPRTDPNNSYSYGITFFMGVRALLYPPFLLKTKIQVARGGASEKSAFQVARATVREEGVRGLYKVKFCVYIYPTKNNSFFSSRFMFAVFLTLSVLALLSQMAQSAAGITVPKHNTQEDEFMPPNLLSEGRRCRGGLLCWIQV